MNSSLRGTIGALILLGACGVTRVPPPGAALNCWDTAAPLKARAVCQVATGKR